MKRGQTEKYILIKKEKSDLILDIHIMLSTRTY